MFLRPWPSRDSVLPMKPATKLTKNVKPSGVINAR